MLIQGTKLNNGINDNRYLGDAVTPSSYLSVQPIIDYSNTNNNSNNNSNNYSNTNTNNSTNNNRNNNTSNSYNTSNHYNNTNTYNNNNNNNSNNNFTNNNNNNTQNTSSQSSSKKNEALTTNGKLDEVTIHVCDDGRKVSKYFFCQRSLLVNHMKYFERFLKENQNNYDLDISVHCDVEIFEWLMAFIHNPCSDPPLDKSIIVSILISSEFLQMDYLVDICLESIAGRLNEIIRLPIDLSCISDKLINKLASLIHPKILSQTKDRKDKILNKLYKRRVELDFSRKGGTRSTSVFGSFNGSIGGNNGGVGSNVGGSIGGVGGGFGGNSNGSNNHRAIAASLTCCKQCGMVYLESCVASLTCKLSPPIVNFRGDFVRRHSSIPSWSLTSYLKTLHAGGMSWEAIYWHVWAACIVLHPVENQSRNYRKIGSKKSSNNDNKNGNENSKSKGDSSDSNDENNDENKTWNNNVNNDNKKNDNESNNENTMESNDYMVYKNLMISALEVDKYEITEKGILIFSRPHSRDISNTDSDSILYDDIDSNYFRENKEISRKTLHSSAFSLSNEDNNIAHEKCYNVNISCQIYNEHNAANSVTNNSPYNTANNTSNNAANISDITSTTTITATRPPISHIPIKSTQNTQPFTSSLNPHRPIEILSQEIHDLLSSQSEFIAGVHYRELIKTASRSGISPVVSSVIHSCYDENKVQKFFATSSFARQLWGDSEVKTLGYYTPQVSTIPNEMDQNKSTITTIDTTQRKDRGRSRSASKTRKPALRSSSKPQETQQGKQGQQAQQGTQQAQQHVVDCRISHDSDDNQSNSQGNVKLNNSRNNLQGNKSIPISQLRKNSTPSSTPSNRRNGHPSVSSSTTPNTAPILSTTSATSTTITTSTTTVAASNTSNGDDKHGENKYEISSSINDNLQVLSALPTDVYKLVEIGRGAVGDVWLTTHPLQVQPLSLTEKLLSVSEANKDGEILSLEKQLIWELDIIREYDENCMERYESFLSSKRHPSLEEQVKSKGSHLTGAVSRNHFGGSMGTGVSGSSHQQGNQGGQGIQKSVGNRRQKGVVPSSYYKDKGRQSNR